MPGSMIVGLLPALDQLRHHGIAARERLRCRGLLPRLLRDRPLVDADERLAGLAIEDVRPPGLPDFSDRLPRAATDVHVHQDDGIDRVVVPDVVVHLLKVPLVLSGLHLDGDHRDGVEVIAGAHGAVVIGTGVAGGEIDKPELRVDRRRLPDRRAAVLPGVAPFRPRFGARLTRSRDRVERPDEPPVSRVERLDAAARSLVGAGKAGDHHAVEVDRGGGDREVVLPALGLDRPRHPACRALDRHELAIELPDEHHVLAERHTLVVPTAANRGDGGVDVRRVLPEDFASVDRQRKHVVGTRAHVGHTVGHQRLRKARVLRGGAGAAQPRAPHALELRHVVAVDRLERRVALVVEVAAIGGPATERQPGERGGEKIPRASA
jgi:hypothetical protein